MEERRNRRVGRELRAAVESETANGRAYRRFTAICLCSEEIRCHEESAVRQLIAPNRLVRKELLLHPIRPEDERDPSSARQKG
jgi:hypothetical protein